MKDLALLLENVCPNPNIHAIPNIKSKRELIGITRKIHFHNSSPNDVFDISSSIMQNPAHAEVIAESELDLSLAGDILYNMTKCLKDTTEALLSTPEGAETFRSVRTVTIGGVDEDEWWTGSWQLVLWPFSPIRAEPIGQYRFAFGDFLSKLVRPQIICSQAYQGPLVFHGGVYLPPNTIVTLHFRTFRQLRRINFIRQVRNRIILHPGIFWHIPSEDSEDEYESDFDSDDGDTRAAGPDTSALGRFDRESLQGLFAGVSQVGLFVKNQTSDAWCKTSLEVYGATRPQGDSDFADRVEMNYLPRARRDMARIAEEIGITTGQFVCGATDDTPHCEACGWQVQIG